VSVSKFWKGKGQIEKANGIALKYLQLAFGDVRVQYGLRILIKFCNNKRLA